MSVLLFYTIIYTIDYYRHIIIIGIIFILFSKLNFQLKYYTIIHCCNDHKK